MSTTLETIARNAALNATVALVNGGTIELQTAGDVEVATLALDATAFAAASGGAAVAAAITADAACTGTTAGAPITKAVFKTSGGAKVWTVSVSATGGGGDIELNSVIPPAGIEVGISAYTHSQPAS